MGDRIGDKIGEYQLTRLLGSGAFGDVYLGEHLYEHTLVAIKVLKIQLTPEILNVFLAEVRTLFRLKHPHIVQLLDFGIEEHTPFLVMDYAPGGTLYQRHLVGSRLPLNLACTYAHQVATALQFAHDRRIIHCDVKPQNMLIGYDQQVLLSDFGIAAIAHSERSSITQEMSGTVPYMAPEQIQGKPRPASDQYALGISVYEWLCGVRPFHGSTWEIISQHLTAAPPPLRVHVPTLPAEVETIVLKALAKDPQKRFVHIEAFGLALERAYQEGGQPSPSTKVQSSFSSEERKATPARLSGNGPPPHTPSPISPSVKKSVEQNRPEIPPALLDHIPVPLSSPFQPLSSPSTVPVALSQPPASINRPVPLMPNQPRPSRAASPNQNKLKKIERRHILLGLVAFGAVTGGAAAALLWEGTHQGHVVAKIATPVPTTAPTKVATPTPLPVGKPFITYRADNAGVADVKGLAWSPDGRQLIASTSGNSVHIWNATTGKDLLSPPYTRHASGVKSVAWSPDGKLVASGGEDLTVRVWYPDTGADLPSSPYKKHTKAVRSVSWSPDNRQLIASGSEDTTVRVWSAVTGTDLPFSPYTRHTDLVITVAWSPDGARIASASFDSKVRVWDAASGQDSLVIAHPNGVRAVAWSHDRQYIASGTSSSDSKVYIWHADSGRLLQTFTGHTNSVQAVAWSPDEKHLASASFDKTVKIWEVASGKCVLTYTFHKDAVWTVAWSPDGSRIASGGFRYDSTVQIWKPL